jgi:hypothetical protein
MREGGSIRGRREARRGDVPALCLFPYGRSVLLWRSHSGLRCWCLRHQSCKRREVGFCPCGPQQPLAEPEHIQPHRCQDMSQTDPCQPDVAGAAQTCTPCAARDGAFNPGAAGVLRLKRLGRFALPGRLERLVLRLRPDGERPPGGTRLRAYTLGYVVAAPAIFGRELHRDDGIPAIIDGRRPAGAGLAGRTGRVRLVPIDLEMLDVKAGPCTGLPVIVEACGGSNTLDSPPALVNDFAHP